jgi:hypothetical protein
VSEGAGVTATINGTVLYVIQNVSERAAMRNVAFGVFGGILPISAFLSVKQKQ